MQFSVIPRKHFFAGNVLPSAEDTINIFQASLTGQIEEKVQTLH